MAHHHHKHMQLEKRNPDYQTMVSIVYVTASKTFSGEVGGYITLGGSQSTQGAQKGTPIQNSAAAASTGNAQVKGTPVQQSDASASATDDSSNSGGAPIRSQRPARASSSSTTTSTATLIPSSAAAVVGTPIALSTSLQTSIAPTSNVVNQHTTLLSSVIPAVAAVSSTALASISATASPEAQSTEGPSTGAKAGIAIGIILAFAVIAGLILFLVRRKRSNKDEDGSLSQRLDDEKRSAGRQSSTSVNSSRFSVAKSVLSLPRLSLGPTMSEKQERPTLKHTDSLTNPFEDAKHEVISDNQINKMVTIPIPAPLNFKGGDRPISPNPPGSNAPAGGRTSPSGAAPSNVHRVQLDFKPSMDDELELKSGQIIRMLHEYDDGWALCKRLDGAQQGVVPRSCLSKLPLKRRDGPPGPRPMNGRQQAPGHRVPSGGSVSSVNSYLSEEAVPRPLSPAGRVRAQSNASTGPVNQALQINENARQRANSAGAATKLAVNPSMSPLNPAIQRRPVPGSAM